MASPLAIPGNQRPYVLGRSEYHDTLNEFLSKYAFGKFWVTNEDQEQQLRAVRCAFDDDVNFYTRTVLTELLGDGDHEALFRLLLSLGIDPDMPIRELNLRPSHYTTCWGRPSCARALAPCRPDLTAVEIDGGTPRTTTENL